MQGHLATCRVLHVALVEILTATVDVGIPLHVLLTDLLEYAMQRVFLFAVLGAEIYNY